MVALVLLISYLFGSVSFALVIGKLFFKKDVRHFGSGNLGATNTYRTLGTKAGISVAVGDILKGTLACFLPVLLNVDIEPIYCGIFAIVGHIFPVFAGFKGGKAVATSTGVFLFLSPIGIAFSFVFFVATLFLFKYVSLSSMIASFALFIYCFFFENHTLAFVSFMIFVAILVLHRENIRRLIQHTESKINATKKK